MLELCLDNVKQESVAMKQAKECGLLPHSFIFVHDSSLLTYFLHIFRSSYLPYRFDFVATITFTEIINYAAKLSKYTSAPPNFDPANREITFEKPYPDEDRMRQGLLYRQYQTVPEQGDVFGEWMWFKVLISS